jgi:type I restriction enzyme S subunit
MEKIKNIPSLRFPEFNKDWENTRLGEVAKFSKGKGISKSEISENGVNECIRYGELYTRYGEVIQDIYSKTNFNIDKSVISEANDVIIPASGETQIDIATASCVMKSGVILGGDLNIIKTNKNGVFLSYYLNSKRKLDIANLSQGISVVHLYSSQLALLNLNFPSLQEQNKIATFLTTVEDKLQSLKQKKTLLDQYKKGVMKRLFSQEIRFKDDNENDYPDWDERNLGEILIEKNEKTNSSGQYRILSSTAKGLFNQDEYFTRDIASKDNTGYKILRKYQLVFSPQNLWLGNINVNMNFEIGIVSPSYKIFSFDEKFTLAEYCQYFLLTPKMLFEYEQSSTQGASVVRRNLDMDKFLTIEFLLPSIAEQTKIANFLSAIDDKINHCQEQIVNTEVWKKGLLQQMFV